MVLVVVTVDVYLDGTCAAHSHYDRFCLMCGFSSSTPPRWAFNHYAVLCNAERFSLLHTGEAHSGLATPKSSWLLPPAQTPLGPLM